MLRQRASGTSSASTSDGTTANLPFDTGYRSPVPRVGPAATRAAGRLLLPVFPAGDASHQRACPAGRARRPAPRVRLGSVDSGERGTGGPGPTDPTGVTVARSASRASASAVRARLLAAVSRRSVRTAATERRGSPVDVSVRPLSRTGGSWRLSRGWWTGSAGIGSSWCVRQLLHERVPSPLPPAQAEAVGQGSLPPFCCAVAAPARPRARIPPAGAGCPGCPSECGTAGCPPPVGGRLRGCGGGAFVSRRRRLPSYCCCPPSCLPGRTLRQRAVAISTTWPRRRDRRPDRERPHLGQQPARPPGPGARHRPGTGLPRQEEHRIATEAGAPWKNHAPGGHTRATAALNYAAGERSHRSVASTPQW